MKVGTPVVETFSQGLANKYLKWSHSGRAMGAEMGRAEYPQNPWVLWIVSNYSCVNNCAFFFLLYVYKLTFQWGERQTVNMRQYSMAGGLVHGEK